MISVRCISKGEGRGQGNRQACQGGRLDPEGDGDTRLCTGGKCVLATTCSHRADDRSGAWHDGLPRALITFHSMIMAVMALVLTESAPPRPR
jgi:hypothetical protein